MSGPPQRLKISEVPAYVHRKFNLKVSRQTVYNWMNLGVQNETLQYISAPVHADRPERVRVTTTEWVNAFCHRAGIVGA